jgi:mutator protein MutT
VRFGIKLLINKRIIAGVPAIIMNNEREILLGKRDKNMLYYPNTWGLPGGVIEFKETIEQAIKRELKEELGVDSEVTKYGKPSMGLPSKECPMQNLSIPVYCRIKGNPEAKDETSEIKWFPPKEIKNMKLAYDHKKILKQEKII